MTRARLSLDAWHDREIARRHPRKKSANWRTLSDGSPSSDGIQADIAGACRLMWGAPGVLTAQRVLWYDVEQRGQHSRAGFSILGMRGVIGGTPEKWIYWFSPDGLKMYPGEIKRPAYTSLVTGKRVAEEDLTPAQKAVHPEFERAGYPVNIWRSREEFVAWVVRVGLPHKTVRF